MNSAYLLNSEQVKEICSETNSDYVITGFVHETKAGNFLNPDQSSGIMAYLYNKNGSQVVQIQYIGASRWNYTITVRKSREFLRIRSWNCYEVNNGGSQILF
ncbi:hypothetical protein LEP1GSC016_0745 [Leptospira borgpetersenii serovar Hardjo-bovis str. Sponselee]|uniref:Uncharacterized protein n=1 Tax=Leptospira borgpetersenii serovar Hardjo-bovis str. Sponselee TaxID=1303729 RepID=M6BPL4_LEPBO|nr:hypothetical protein LBK6_05065 [Leptospira borgpetersenii serovar Hardjo]EMJ78298.1 hypothetical protein LEP1GSC016_0745 [Leptospira borgpetersenii serovar Hardjo-bovis str. Sponselee]AMX60978.1 hypothetical protein LBK9_05000 [Leptospira borgpetersenii serovar Hardjo]AMX64221.1 hypothetical protein LBK30_05030 [Leptospira borgpetersenii serovar Hardjo]AMX67462.1 hypothetical protein LBHA_05015 [Leptospira borgpetersenii serovar Hardjo]